METTPVLAVPDLPRRYPVPPGWPRFYSGPELARLPEAALRALRLAVFGGHASAMTAAELVASMAGALLEHAAGDARWDAAAVTDLLAVVDPAGWWAARYAEFYDPETNRARPRAFRVRRPPPPGPTPDLATTTFLETTEHPAPRAEARPGPSPGAPAGSDPGAPGLQAGPSPGGPPARRVKTLAGPVPAPEVPPRRVRALAEPERLDFTVGGDLPF